VLVSDTHLTSARPEDVEQFLRFLRGPCTEAARVILLGDLFDFWVSPSQLRDPAVASVLAATRELLDAGVDVGFVEGNRDFAATPDLAAAGIRPLPDVGVLESGGRRIAFTHGDQMCTRDTGYQAVRRLIRTGFVRHVLRALPTRTAIGIGQSARATSKQSTARKDYASMGLVPTAVVSLLRAHEADALICGHVHWGQRFEVDIDGAPHDVVVLSAWEDAGTYARVEYGRIDFLEFA
jgi:UDP-2,3-diacylglucosamine hydrolase